MSHCRWNGNSNTSNPMSQRATFSSYKNKIGWFNTWWIEFILAYGGSASDRQIIERSQLSSVICDGR